MERLSNFFLNPPTVAKDWGAGLFTAGSAFFMAGMYGHVATTAGQGRTLAELYPILPTWFIPEGLFGFTLAALVVVAGVTLNRIGAKFEKY